MQELVAVAVIIGMIALCVTVAFVNFRFANLSEIRFLSHNGTVAAVSSRRSGATGETVEIDFANLGARAVVVGLSLRWQFWPAWFGAQSRTRVPSSAGGRRYLPGAQETIGVIPANGTARLPIRVRSGLCRRVVAVAGEADGHLRVISMRIPPQPPTQTDPYVSVAIADFFTWLL